MSVPARVWVSCCAAQEIHGFSAALLMKEGRAYEGQVCHQHGLLARAYWKSSFKITGYQNPSPITMHFPEVAPPSSCKVHADN
eukprot:3635440-Amphidinium_carterae.1